MKVVKKISLLFVLCLGVLFLGGCNSATKVEGTLEELMEKVYAEIPDDNKPSMLMNTVVNDENIEYYLGTKDIQYEEALASESGIGSIAHSVVLLRAKENADVEEIKEKILENVNPRKWVCVGVAKEDVIVKNNGDLIILIMVQDESNRDILEENFKNLK